MAGNGELLGMNELSDGQRKRSPLFVALLLMGRNGIVNLGLDAVISEVAFEFVATGTENGEDMVNTIAIERKAVSLVATRRFSGSDTACY